MADLAKKLFNNIYFLVIGIICIISNLATIKYIILGVYGWHSVQPETVQGGLELLTVFFIFCFILIYLKKKQVLLFLAIAAFYLQRNQVLLPVITALLYFEIIILIGRRVSENKIFKCFSEINTIFYYLKNFFIGFIVWCLGALVLSYMGYGTFVELQIMTIVFMFISIQKFNGPKSTLTVSLLKKILVSGKGFKLGFSFVSTIMLMQFAKTNRAIDYDSIWYGLRPEWVLLGNHSFFDSNGLVEFVHYYPKLFELFTVPLSTFGDYSFISSINVMFFGLLILLVYMFTVKLIDNKKYSIIFIVILSCTPAIANMASTAKMDLFTAFFILFGTFFFWCFYEYKHISLFLLACSSFLIAMGGKITSLMFVPLVILGFICFFMLKWFNNKENPFSSASFTVKQLKLNLSLSVCALLSSFFIFFSVCYRTYRLTGHPFYPFLGSLWEHLGFKIKYPFLSNGEDLGLIEEKNWFIHWAKIIFNPNGYVHYIMVWPGNVYLILIISSWLILVFYSYDKNMNKKALKLFFIMLPVFLSTIYCITTFPKGGDGNYYIISIIFSVLAFIPIFNLTNKNLQKYILICLLLYVPIQSFVTLVSHFSWSWGTSKFELSLTNTNFDTENYNADNFKKIGVEKIANYIKENGGKENCIGLLDKDGQEFTLNQLSCKFEDIQHMASIHGNPALFRTKESFLQYLSWANVRYIIVSKKEVTDFIEVKKVISDLDEKHARIKIDDVNFYLIDLDNFFKPK